MIEEVPDGWSEMDTEFEQQLQAFQRRRDGLVVSVEKHTSPDGEYSVVTLPENFVDDNSVIDWITDNDSRTEADSSAVTFMRNRDR